ncbi:unnamed protein product, partial [marine sediment metagenome]
MRTPPVYTDQEIELLYTMCADRSRPSFEQLNNLSQMGLDFPASAFLDVTIFPTDNVYDIEQGSTVTVQTVAEL